MATTELSKRYQQTMNLFREACRQAGRPEDSVRLIAVSKFVPASGIWEAYDLGQRLFGENRAQEISEKQPLLPKNVEWHFIGRLQRNKVKYIIDKVAMIHSVDSLELAREISRQAVMKAICMPVLIQVNLEAEATKAGFAAAALRPALEAIAGLPGLRVRGLMTIGPYYQEPEDARPLFRRMRALKAEAGAWETAGAEMRYLSMGMSHDFTVAIGEGADFVRVGSAIFGDRR